FTAARTGGERDPGVCRGGEFAEEGCNGLGAESGGEGETADSGRGEGGRDLVGLLGDRPQEEPPGPAVGSGELSSLYLVEEAAPGADHAVAVVDGGLPRVRAGACVRCMDGAVLRYDLGSEQGLHAGPVVGERSPGLGAVGVECPKAGPAPVGHAGSDVLAAEAGGHGGPQDGPAGFGGAVVAVGGPVALEGEGEVLVAHDAAGAGLVDDGGAVGLGRSDRGALGLHELDLVAEREAELT